MTDPAATAAFAGHYDAQARWGAPLDADNRERIARTHALVPAGARSVLDVGCGDGASSNALAERCRVVACDISPRAVAMAAGTPVVAATTHLPFPDRSFDLVMALEVIEHLPDGPYQRALAELARASGRWLLVSTPHAEHLPAGLARCPRCGAVTHRNLHARSFAAADHDALFAAHGFAHRRTELVAWWRPSPAWTALRHRALGRHGYRPIDTCPACGLRGADAPPPPRAARLTGRLIDAVAWRTTRPIPRWVVSLHERAPEGEPE